MMQVLISNRVPLWDGEMSSSSLSSCHWLYSDKHQKQRRSRTHKPFFLAMFPSCYQLQLSTRASWLFENPFGHFGRIPLLNHLFLGATTRQKKWSDACLGSFRKSTTMTEHHKNLSFMFTAHPFKFDPLLWNIVLFILIWLVETPNLPPKTNMEIWRCSSPWKWGIFPASHISFQVFSSVMTWTP